MLKEILNDLDFRKSDLMQERAVNKIIEMKNDISEDEWGNLIMMGGKFTWPNIIKVFSIVGYPKMKKAIPSLLMLMQDLNWPGSLDSQKVLNNIYFEFYKNEFSEAINNAVDEGDIIWCYNLLVFAFEYGYIKKLEYQLVTEVIDIINCDNEDYGKELKKYLNVLY